MPAPMEGVERTNAVVVRGSGQGMGTPPRRDPYAMDVMIQCSKCLSKELTLVLSDTRELNRVPNTK